MTRRKRSQNYIISAKDLEEGGNDRWDEHNGYKRQEGGL